ncbi:MAG: hypothetical protein H0T77_13460 [Pyrinomonadaceae bacterium]|nr:hypothetical protein [Pyrinomonadaceae bacterium]
MSSTSRLCTYPARERNAATRHALWLRTARLVFKDVAAGGNQKLQIVVEGVGTRRQWRSKWSYESSAIV